MKTLWTKPIDHITYADVKDFVVSERVRENEMVEYKQDFPSDELAKWLCAFANTNGGILLLGVAYDPNDREYPGGIPGVETTKVTRNRIDQEAWKVTPPIPNLVECSDPLLLDGDPTRCVQVVRVQASEADKGHNVGGIVYVRTDGSSRPYMLADSKRVGIATVDEVLAIIRKREEAIAYRKAECAACTRTDDPEYVLVAPRFPGPFQANVSLHGLLDIAHHKAALRLDRNRLMPCSAISTNIHREAWGVRFKCEADGGDLYVRKSGVIVNSHLRGEAPYLFSSKEGNFLVLPNIVRKLVCTTAYAVQVYRHIRLWGQALVGVRIPHVSGRHLYVESALGHGRTPSVDTGTLSASMCFPVTALAKDPIETLRPLITELLFPCGGEQSDDLAGRSIAVVKSTLLVEAGDTGRVFFTGANWTQDWLNQ